MKSKPNFKLNKLNYWLVAVIGIVLVMPITINTYREWKTMQNYLTYSSKNPVFDFVFKYPRDWPPHESSGRTERYESLQLLGPRDEENEFSLGFSVTIKPADNKSEAELLSEFIVTASRFKNYKTLEEKTTSIHGRTAPTATYQHLMRHPMGKTNAKDVLMKGESFFLKKGNSSYRFTFFGTAEQFDQNLPAFKRIVKSFRFEK